MSSTPNSPNPEPHDPNASGPSSGGPASGGAASGGSPSGGSPSGGGRPPVDPSGSAAPPPPPPGHAAQGAPPPGYAPPPAAGKGGKGWRVFAMILAVLLLFSVTANVWMFNIYNVLLTGPSEVEIHAGDTDQRIVVLPIEGMIASEAEAFVSDSLHRLRDNPPAALVLRVDSGGGTVGASDRIYHMLVRFREYVNEEHGREMPVVASFGTVAASGGYYVSMAADQIYAENTTRAGSIGVLATTFSVGGLLEKIGVTAEMIEAPGSPNKDIANNPLRPLNEEDRAKLKNVLESAHQRFIQVVKQGRSNLTQEELDEVTKGDIYTAEQAKAKKLVDEIGYLEDAVQAASDAAGLGDNPRVTRMRKPPQMSLMSFLAHNGSNSSSANTQDLSAGQVRNWLLEAQAPRVMYYDSVVSQ